MSTIKAVFFDAGNTLLHLDYEYIKSVVEGVGCSVEVDALMRAEYQARFDLDKIVSGNLRDLVGKKKAWTSKGHVDGYFTTILSGAKVPSDYHPLILKKLWERNSTMELWVVIQEGTHDALAQIKREGYMLGVISNSEGRLENKLKDLGLHEYFNVIIDSGIVGVEKPNPQIFQLALSRVGVKAEESIYVGDIYSIDVLGARSAGLRAVLMDRLGLYNCVDCPTISKLADLLETLKLQ